MLQTECLAAPALNRPRWTRLLENYNTGVSSARLRRKQARFRIEGQVLLALYSPESHEKAGKTIRGSLIEASSEGLAMIVTPEPLPIGTKIGVQMRIGSETAYVRGKVANCRRQPGGIRLGVLLEFGKA